MLRTDYSEYTCVGALSVSGYNASASLVRRTGGGTSSCCSIHPIAAPARVSDTVMELMLQPRFSTSQSSRNGARLYLADECVEGSFASTRYAAVKPLGRTLSITVDCNAARTRTLVYRALADSRPPFASLVR